MSALEPVGLQGLAPLACKTDEIDSMVLATRSQRDLVSERHPRADARALLDR